VSERAANSRAFGPLRGPTVGDFAVTGLAFGLTLALLASAHGADRHLDVLGVVLAAIASLPLLAHRRWPLWVFALTATASAGLIAFGYAAGPPFGPTVALFFAARDERPRLHPVRTALLIAVLFVVHIGANLFPHSGFPTVPVLFGIVVWGGAWMIGDQVRQRRRRRLEIEERLRRAEQDTARERRLAAAEERTRIARDLHDSAAHAINVILVQAGAARLLQERDPDAVRAALSTIEDVARETIGEIDVLVRGLREGDNGKGPAAIEPPAGMAALESLAERHRAGGLPIEIDVHGAVRLLPRGLDQAAYRILQEALTNAARHGNGGARVDVEYGGGAFELTITNQLAPGAAGQTPAGGHGILGMRERVSLLGGILEARREADLFRVRARIPYDGVEEQA
jgi:signal transduction histidine kinase